jgi:HSP20 family protein
MNPNDMAAAGGVIADFMDMAQKWQASNPGFPQNGPSPAMQLPLLVDLEENEEVYTLTADVPGLQKSDLKITVNKKDRTLTISGERKRATKAIAEPVDAQKQEQEQAKQQQQQFRQRNERIMGKFQRTLQRLPEDADLSAVSARVEKGVLTITVKKTEQRRYEDFVEINVD